MKNNFLLFTAAFLISPLFSSTSYAVGESTNSELLYPKLNVSEESVGSEDDIEYFQKSVGRLNCTRTSSPKSRNSKKRVDTFSCSLDIDSANDLDIYKALDVEDVDVTPEGRMGSSTHEKRLGSLVCNRSSAVVPRPKPTARCRLE